MLRRIPWRLAPILGPISLGLIFSRVSGHQGLSAVGNHAPLYRLPVYLDHFRNYFGHLVLWKTVSLPLALVIALFPLLLRNGPAVFAAKIPKIGFVSTLAVIFAALFLRIPAQDTMAGWDCEYTEIDRFRHSLEALAPNMPKGVQIRFLS